MQRDDEILAAATLLFAQRGFDATSVDALAAEANLTGSAIYRHFSGKDEILAALFDRLIDALLVRIGTPAEDPVAELDRLVGTHIAFALDNPELTTIWTRERAALAQVYRANFLRRQRVYIDRWITALELNYPGHPRERLATTVRAVHGLISSDTARPANVRRIPGLAQLLHEMTQAALASLAVRSAVS